MKVRVLPENLTNAVIEAGRAAPSRPSLPQLGSVLLETYEGRLRVTGSDLEMAIRVYSGAQVEEEGSALVPAAMLGKMLNTFPDDSAITLEGIDKHTLKLTADGRTFTVKGQDPADYPPISDTPTLAFKLDGLQLRQALTRILPAAATDTRHPALQAIHFGERDGQLTLAAVDGFRLAVHDLPHEGAVPEMLVPAQTLRELLRLLPKPKDNVEATVRVFADGGNNARFELHSREVVTMLVQGTFPNYQQLIPVGYDGAAQVDTKELRRALAAALILASQGSGIVRFLVGPGDTLTVQARVEEEGEFEAVLPAVMRGPGKVAHNAHYIDDFLKTVGTEAVELRMTTPTAPALWLPVGEDGYSQTIMPMIVQW